MRKLKAILPMLAMTLCIHAAAPSKAGEASDVLNDIAAADCMAEEAARVLLLRVGGETATVACGRERIGGSSTNSGSRFLIASVSKLYLAVALMQLDEAGRLDIDDPAARWLPGDIVDAFDGLDGISIASLLTMTSGVPDYLDDAFFHSSIADARAGISDRNILIKAVLSVADEPRLFDPGAGFDYSNTNYLLAQLILEQAAGAPMHEVFEDRLFKPAGLTRTQLLGYGLGPEDFVQGFEDFSKGLEPVEPYLTGYGFGDGGLVTTAGEVADFYKALFQDGALLSGDSLARLLQDPSGEGYGMGIEIETFPGVGEVLGHSGGDTGFSADVRYLPEHAVTVVYLSALAEEDLSLAWELLEALP